ncbi:cutinase family protein [Dermacoccaceae bacterium W4C1]
MSFRRSVTALTAAALASGALGAAALSTAPGAEAACSNKLFMVDGYKNGPTGGSFVNNHPAAPAGWTQELFRYQDGIFPVVDPQTLDVTVSRAVPSLIQKAEDYHRACPGAKIAFEGYSFGALIAGNAVESIGKKNSIPKNQMNAVLYGDPRRPAQKKGIEGSAGGILTVLPNLPGITAPGPRDLRGIDVSWVCNQNDVICNMANPFTNALAVANEVQGYFGPTRAHSYRFNPYGEHSHPGDHFNKQTQLIRHGAPLPLPIGTPNQIFNSNPAYIAAIAALSQVANGLGWASVLNERGLPGDQIVSVFRKFAADNGLLI